MNFSILFPSRVLIFLLCAVISCQARKKHPALEASVGVDPKRASCSDTPSPKRKVQFPDSLAGRSIASQMEMYTGYIEVTAAPDYLFYWFYPTLDGNDDAPLVVWTNGGPGCSSMEGASTENSPLVLFDIKEACSSSTCDFTNQLSTNPYGWNQHANVLYIDQPRYVGNSFGYGDYTTSSVAAGQDFVTFYTNWLQYFPEFVGRPVVLSGESYGGHYIPAFANAVMEHNHGVKGDALINLSGLLIGNGCVNDTVQNGDRYIEFMHEENLIPADAKPRNQIAAEAAMIKYLGYTPNYYDYRVQSIDCPACYGYNYSEWSAWFLRSDVLEALGICGQSGQDAFSGNAGGCITIPNFDARDTFDYSDALGKALDSGIPVTLYYGKTDTACNYVGGYAMASTIPWKGAVAFTETPLVNFEIAGAAAGETKAFGGLTWIQVESAGHMVPLDQPPASLIALNSILDTLSAKHKKQ